MARGLFVTGTDTEVGKTVVSLLLVRALVSKGYRVAGMKPVASGSALTAGGLRNDDALKLLAAGNVSASYDEVNPYAFEPAIAPHLAAQDVGVKIRMEEIERCYRLLASRADWVIVEGVGGWRVPLGDDLAVDEMAEALRLPVVLVVGVRLGCINHALLSVESIQRGNAELLGWIANICISDGERSYDIIKTLDLAILQPRLATVPFSSAPDMADIAVLDTARILDLT